ncbi:MAG: hypothetical protein AB1413_10225 [Thermodesulfobacteriota bacterium]
MQNSISETGNDFMEAVLQGLSDLDEGRELSLAEARLLLSRTRLGDDQTDNGRI